METNELRENVPKKPVVRFANASESTSDDTTTDKILSGIEKMLRAVEQNASTSASSSNASINSENLTSTSGSSNNTNGNRNGRSNARCNNGSRNRNFSPDRENRDPKRIVDVTIFRPLLQAILITTEMDHQSIGATMMEIFGEIRIISIHPLDQEIISQIHRTMVSAIMAITTTAFQDNNF